MTQASDVQLLVTGASGFLGSTIVSRARIAGLTTFAATRNEIDQSDAAALSELVAKLKPHYAIDAAGVLPGRGSVDQNVALTKSWLDVIGALDAPPRLVLIGSAAIYGTGSAQNRATREDDPMKPVSAYGRAKLEALDLAREAFAKRGCDVQTGIVFNLIGAGQPTHLAPQVFIQHAIDYPDTEQSVGSVETVRDFMDVEDVADALIAMVQSGQRGDVMNIATGQPTRIRDLLDRLRLELGARWVSEKQHLREGEIDICYGDPTRFIDRTGLEPRFGFDQALKRAINATLAAKAAQGRS